MTWASNKQTKQLALRELTSAGLRTRRLKLLLVSGRSDEGGGPRQMLEIASALCDAFEVHAALPVGGVYWERFRVILNPEHMVGISHRRTTPNDFRAVDQHLRSHDIDVVHTHGFAAGLLGRPVAAARSVASIHTYHGIHLGSRGPVGRSAYRFVERLLSRCTDCLVAVSLGEAAQAKMLGLSSSPGRTVVLPNGVPVCKSAAAFGVAPRSLSDGSGLRVAAVMRCNAQKNPETFAKVLRRVAELGILGEVSVACPEGDSDAIRESLEREGVGRFVGRVGPVDRCNELFAANDVLLSTSRWEGLPLAPLEAMAQGTPVILSEVVGHMDITDKSTSGAARSFPLDQPALAADHVRSLSAQAEWSSASAEATQIIRDHFDIVRMTDLHGELYARIVDGRAKARNSVASDRQLGET